MRIVAAPFACLLMLAAEAASQSSWQKVDVSSLGVSASSILNSVTTSGNLVLSTVSGDPTYKAVRSTDFGQTWETPPLTVLAPTKLKALSSSFLYGVRGDSIMISTTGGLSWPSPLRPSLGMLPIDVHYINSSPGQAWAVGDSPYVSVTPNGWSSFVNHRFLIPFDSVSMSSVQLFDNNLGFVAGRSRKNGSNASVILRTTDGGVSWQDRGLPDTCPSTPLLAVDFISPQIGWAAQTCGTSVTIYKTVDSGFTWSPQDTINIFLVFAIDAVDSLHAWVAGQLGVPGAIARTSNGGVNWTFETVPSSGRLLSIAMRDTSHGFACGQSAALLVYSPVGTDVPGERANRPKGFELSQNYPNPFNAETRIRFTLQKSQAVTLTIYNVLGQPVRKLLDEARPAGKNEVSWDGRDYRGLAVPSGIYLYKLGTPEEKQVRKMVLLK